MKNKDEEILNFIIDYMFKNDYPPSIREICTGVNLKSTSSVYAHLEKLKTRGSIDMKEKAPRTITIPGIHYIDDRT